MPHDFRAGRATRLAGDDDAQLRPKTLGELECKDEYRAQITGAAISAGRITIQWSNGGTLESTTSLSSPINWTTTGNSSGTFSETATGTKFYRVSK